MIWRLLNSETIRKVSEVIEIQNKSIPPLKAKYDARHAKLSRDMSDSKRIAKNASSIAILRGSKLHQVWPMVASKLK